MNKRVFFCNFTFLGVLLLMSCSSAKSTTEKEFATNVEQSNINDSWELVFEENFNADLSAWNIWEGGAFNEEVQLYRAEQLEVSNGFLKIKAEREKAIGATTIYDPTVKEFDYVSGRLETKELFGPSDEEGEKEYRFLSKIKLPKGFGMWPAFWSFADPWPTKGEIDILEGRGNTPKKFQSNIFFGTQEGKASSTRNEVFYNVKKKLTEDFCVYELIWTKSKLTILLDDEVIGVYEGNLHGGAKVSDLFGNDHKIILNLAVGGMFFPNSNSSSYANEATMEVDWVKVYKR